MKSRNLIIVALLALFWACDKSEKALPTNQTEPDYFPLTTGSYWVYNSYVIDSNKNEELVSKNDTIIITGDTTINGKSYKIFLGKLNLFTDTDKKEKYFRDSVGYIVNSGGNILFTDNNLVDTLYVKNISDDDIIKFRYSTIMEEYQKSIDVQAGVFDSVLNYNFYVESVEANRTYNFENLYAPDVGLIIEQKAYLYSYETSGEYYESRLIDYHIEP